MTDERQGTGDRGQDTGRSALLLFAGPRPPAPGPEGENHSWGGVPWR